MSKFVKLGLVLSVLAFSMVACVKPISTIGTYKSGDYTMTVNSDGSVYFGYIGNLSEEATKSVEYSMMLYGYGTLTPWDLGAVSTVASYETKNKIDDKEVTTTFKFKTDTTKVSCDVEISGVPEANGKNGKVTFTK